MERRRLRGDLNVIYRFLTIGSGKAGSHLFSLVKSDSTLRNGMKMCQGRFRLDIKKCFFTQRMVRCWNSLPREMITTPNSTEFEKCLDTRHMVFLGLYSAGSGPKL